MIDAAVGATIGNLTAREVRDLGRDSRLIEDLALPSQCNAGACGGTLFSVFAVSGFMLPLDFDGGGVSTFILNANYDMCGFGAPTVLNQQVEVTMAGGRRTVYTHRVLRVFGQFEVGERRANGRVVSLFRMVATALEAETP